ncbi:hypothetical protein [Sphingomonas parapaucimobilis]|uniref:hypothetical protein n=1 Tax=Sphingomonas parapaucimobilis TaxID=28213 RepID=UPI00391A59B7
MMDEFQSQGIWPVEDLEDAQVREVYSRYGLAMFMAQVLEHGMVNAMIVVQLLPARSNFRGHAEWFSAFDKFHDAEFSKTFGNMIRALERIDKFPADFIARLQSAKLGRDHLAHRFFRENSEKFFNQAGRLEMIVECEKWINIFQSADRDLDAIVGPLRLQFGISNDLIDQHVNEIRDKSNS